MAEISLRAYIKEIDDLVEHEQLDEAIAYCRHILETYPKHLETYRLLGKAYLEAKRYGDAADLFQRVLSAVPDDFVAHIGMSIVREDEGNLDASIWHMERAFETNPANPAIQQELRRLMGRRDGLEPHKVRLTRGALARMYAHGELYPQAIAELRSALQEDPDRPDLQVLLANLYWRTNQRTEAAQVSGQVLDKLPYCRDANRIIAAALQADSKVDAAATYHRRLASLDPYAAFVETAMVDPQGVDANSVHLQKLIWQPGQPLPSSEPARRDWASSVGERVRRPEEPAPVEGPVPSWLESVPAQPVAPAAAAVADVAAAAVHPFAGAKPTSEPIPEWMRGAGWTEATGEAVEGPVSFSDEELNAPEKAAEPAELAPADIPNWLKDIAPPEAAQPVASDETPSPVPAPLPDWGAELAAPVEPTPTENVPVAPEPPIAQPVQEAAPPAPEPEPLQEPEFEDKAGPQLPPWLDVPTPGATDTIVTWLGDRSPRAQATAPASAPDWMGDTGPLDRLEKAEAAEVEETPAWLGESEFAEEPEPSPSPTAEPAIPGWLSGVAQAASIEEAKVPEVESWKSEPAAQAPESSDDAELQTPEPSAEKTPDWLRAIAETGSAPAPEPPAGSSGEIPPDWLESLIEPTSSEPSAAQAAEAGDDWSGLRPAAEAPPPSATPASDWLAGLRGTAEPSAGPAPRSAPPAPEWLRGIAEPAEEAEAPQPPQPPAPEWLRGLAEPVGRDEADLGKPGAEAPEWLRGIAEPEPAAQTTPAEPLPDDWRNGLISTGPEPAPEFPETREDAAWLAGIAGAVNPDESAQDVSGIQEPAAAAPEFGAPMAPPDWLGELRAAEAPEAAGGESVDWLRDLAAPASPDDAQAPLTESGEWLRGLVIKREANRKSTGGTDWLKGILETEGEDAGSQPPAGAAGAGQPASPTSAEGLPPERPIVEPAPVEPPAAEEPAKPATPAWLQEFAAAGGQEVLPTDETILTRRRPADRLEWRPAEPPSTPAPPAPAPAAAEPIADASTAGELDDDEVYRWLETLAASQDDTESIPFPRVLESGTQPLTEAPAGPAATHPATGGPEESLEWLERLAGETGAQPAPAPSEPEEEAPDWLKSLAEADTIAVAPSRRKPIEVEPPVPAAEEESSEWLPVAEEATSAPAPEVQASEWLPEDIGALSEAEAEEQASDWLPIPEELSAAAVPEEQATDWLPMSEDLTAEAEQLVLPTDGVEVPEEAAGEVPAEPTAMDWLSAAQAEPAPTDESAATGEGIPEWLAPGGAEAPIEPAVTAASAGIEAEGSEWLFEAVPAEPTSPSVAAPTEPVADVPSEPEWMRPVAEAEPAAEPPHTEAGIPEWLREPVEPPSMSLPEEAVAPGPVEPITFEIEPEVPKSVPAAPTELAEPLEPPEPAAAPVALQAEPPVAPEIPTLTPSPPAEAPVALQAEPPVAPEIPILTPAPPAEAPVPKPRPAARVKQAVRPDQLLESARESLASGDVEAAAQAYAKLLKKRSAVDEVISDLHGALERSPNMPALWQVLGDAYMRANLTAEAIEAYRRGLSSL